jgi:hypothetical protein
MENASINNKLKQNYALNDNSCLKNSDHKLLNKFKDKGVAIFMDSKGEISYRLSSNESFTCTKDFNSLENILKNFTGIDVDLSSFNKRTKAKDELDEESAIRPENLIMVIGETFDPHVNKEFIKLENGTYLLNKFRPSYYMQLDCNKVNLSNLDIEKTATFLLILNLVNYDRYRVYWVINWLAYFFQGLKKSQVALVLVGIEGTGKGVVVTNVIKPLFGEKYTKTINDKSLNTKYLGGLVENVLFFHLDEISSQRSLLDSIRNFLKALITNPSITAEKKNKTLEKETPLYGQVLITTNEYDSIEIGTFDRRNTVFSTGNKLENINFLGYGDYDALSNALKDELELVACYLKAYQVDVKMSNTALSTPEKDEMIRQYQMKQQVKDTKQQNILQPKLTKLQKHVLEFVNVIRNRNGISFNSIIDEDKRQLKTEILLDLQYGLFRVENLLPSFKTLYGGRSFSTHSEFLRELQKADAFLFSFQNIRSCQIDGETKDFIVLPPYYA